MHVYFASLIASKFIQPPSFSACFEVGMSSNLEKMNEKGTVLPFFFGGGGLVDGVVEN